MGIESERQNFHLDTETETEVEESNDGALLMKIVIATVFMIWGFALTVQAKECTYWHSKVDPEVSYAGSEIDEERVENLLEGIECLLELEGIDRPGRFYGSKPEVSQTVPKATVSICALYAISELFYGNDDFASAVALVERDLGFNSPETIKLAYVLYRKWFDVVREIGLQEAKRLKLDPFLGTSIRWY